MTELDAILNIRRGLRGRDAEAVLATVVHVTGSSYRRPGARMLIVPDGRRIGCVSGGCLEAEIVKKAWWFTETGAPVVQVYDTTSGDDAVWEFGLGCNGVVHVLLERVSAPETSALLDFLDDHRARQEPVAVVVVVRTGAGSGVRVGDRLWLDEFSQPAGTLCGSHFEVPAVTQAADCLREKKSCLAHLGETDLFVEWIGPPLSLTIFGAGHDAIPLAAFAVQLGWNVTVADGRPSYARPERFAGARHVVRLFPEDPLRDVVIDGESAVVMMTHNYPFDLLLLPHILPLQPRYLGLLGPRNRAERLFSELGLSEPAFVHAPAGLDAGCDRPETIALSIVAEIQAVTNARGGGKLKYRGEPMHTAACEVGTSLGDAEADAVRPSVCGNHV